ncbi:Golgi reassembly-stacking protein 2 [Culex quinquefasciatus]|uniref:Golgi reassembly-stacking protein 2 n=1 Tax=Culex quinquefasciatus TaxID=7176 RepID=UPI0018E36CA0|nr:Golgi reassembly-stacking protein 2 [Culex quinquefasciatus]
MGLSHSISVPGGGTEGYHVLRVQDNSPGQKAGLEAFFDFILAIGNTRLDQDNDTLKELLKANIDKEIQMTVFSSKTQNIRVVNISPSTTWGGQGLLGVSIRFCSFEGANENVWHILEVHPSSPAEEAGLIPFTDYIIGADSILHESEDLFTLIESHEGRPLKMYVYNIDLDSCREVTITANSKWGGEGSLGCGIGYGYLHRIPIRVLPSAGSAPDGKPTATALSQPLQPVPTSAAMPASSPQSGDPNANAAQRQMPFIPMVPPLANTFASTTATAHTDLLTVSQADTTALAGQFASLSTGTDQVNNNSGAVAPATPVNAVTSPAISLGESFYTPPTGVNVPPISPAVDAATTIPASTATIPMYPPQIPYPSAANTTLVNMSYPTVASSVAGPPPTNVPTVNPNVFASSVPPPSSLASDFYQTYGASNPATAPTNQFQPASLSYPPSSTIDFQQQTNLQYQPLTYATEQSAPPIQMYSTFPQQLPQQQQQPDPAAAGVPLFQTSAVTTPISLPGMPPITVSATIQAEALRGLQFGGGSGPAVPQQ